MGWAKRHRGWAAVALLALVFGGSRLAGRGVRRMLGVRATPPAEVTLFLTGDTRGHLELCGCRADQAGGLPGRATLLKAEHPACHLLLDVGNATYGSRKYDVVKFQYILKGMEQMGYDVMNLGVTEAMLDKETLLSTVKQHPGLHFVSCNVVDERSRRPVVEPFVTRTFGGYRIGITGVVRDQLDVLGKGLAVLPPLEALSDWVPRIAGQCDYLVVLAFVNSDTLREIANRFYEVDAVLGGDVQESSHAPEMVNRAFLFSVTDKGKILGKVRLQRSEAGRLAAVDGGGTKVKDTIPGESGILALVGQFKEELRSRQIELAEGDEHLEAVAAPARSPDADRYVGSEACKGCHAAEYAAWVVSAHHGSLDTLRPRKSQFDPECLRCHTTGSGASDGFAGEEKTPLLGRVTCEACHGRGQKHVQAMQSGEKPALSTFRAVTPNTCIRCHDEENSADFEYRTYWPRIRHGKPGG